MFDYQEIGNALIACNQAKVMELVDTALKEKSSANEILNKGLITGMDAVGEKCKAEKCLSPRY